jgi:mRNA interferase MazF
MRRGDIWTVAGGGDYAGKPRPVVIIQDDHFDSTASITICAFTSDETEAPLFRLPVAPSARNRLLAVSRLMVDKITTVPKSKIGRQIGGSMTRICCGSTVPYWFSSGSLARRRSRFSGH